MSNKSLLRWLKDGQITIPNALLAHYAELKLNESELVLLLHVLSFIEKGNDFPTPVELSSSMTISPEQCADLLRRLIQKGFIEIMDGFTEEGIRFEKYSLDLLWEKLVSYFLLSEKHHEVTMQKQDERDVYSCFEQEFGRPLSPFECETLSMWLDEDQHHVSIVKAALREAVISGKLNFRYIDRILFEWKKNGIKTIEQAKNQGRKFRQHQKTRPKDGTGNRELPFYNWLNDDTLG
nr:DnaD domain-containing protein [uncultured Bacillus sp.]